MNVEEYHRMHALERKYWWFQGRRRVLLTMLERIVEDLKAGREGEPGADARPRIVDIGCGTGLLLEDLGRSGFAAGLDFSPLALQYCKGRNLENVGRADVRHLPFRTGSVDLITAIDLVEHIQDDVGLMGEFARVLKPGGYALLSVPAHPELWSPHDVALHHFRRYTKPQFRQLVEDSGLTARRYTYSMATAYVPAQCFRRVKRRLAKRDPSAEPSTDRFHIPAPLNALLRACVFAEAAVLRVANLPFGLSLLCIAQKPR